MKWRVVMLRKLAVFIISAGILLSPLSVQALGFGGIKLKSSLNEKLDAEVALLSANADDIESLTIRLATEEAFLRSGINRTALLNKLKFKIKQKGGGYYIHVTTSESVREPFMNFLLELNWKNGRMLREYTMLIDPPGRAPRLVAEAVPVIAETVAPELEVEPEFVEEEPVAFIEEETIFVEPVAEVDVETEAAPSAEFYPGIEEEPAEEPVGSIADVDIPQPELEEAIATQQVDEAFAGDDLWPRIPLNAFNASGSKFATVGVTEETISELGDLDYGLTRAGDNLWNIAEKLRQGDQSVSIYQVMMALLKSNPDAFVDNNVHRLKVGHVLRIDDPAVLASLSRKKAANSFIEQTEIWNDYRRQVAGAPSVQPITVGDNTADSGIAADTTGELTLSSPDGESLIAGGGSSEESLNNDLATMQEQLRQAKSDAGTMRTRNVALNNKLQSLEDELNRLQRSLSVKDDELAALQQQLSSLNEQLEEQPPVAVKKPKTPAVTEPVLEQPQQAEQGIMDTVTDVIASIKATATEIIADLDWDPDWNLDLDLGMGLGLKNDDLLFIGAPILLVLLIIIMVVFKRRRQGDNFQESILTGGASAGTNNMQGGDSTFSEESSFLSDFAMSGASAIDADDSEVDPLTEADVFMAYGRYEAAEERLNEAIKNEPNRMELRAKLLELYHATQNKASFESSAEDFYASLGGNEAGNPLWSNVVSMGKEIAAENPLFNQGGGGADMLVPAMDDDFGMEMTDSELMDIGLETGVFTAADLGGSTDSSSDDMDFNLDLGESTTTADEESMDMDFNLDMGAVEPTEEAAGLDFDLDIGGDGSSVVEEVVADLDLDMGTVESGDAGLDFDLDIGGGGDLAADDMSLDFDMGTSGNGALDLNLDASDTADVDLGGGDEVGTKLDLAKAYIDMGDPEGARSILDEVMDEGSSTQKEEAQSLLGQIA